MLYCLLYLLCPRMYHELFVADRQPTYLDQFRMHPPRDEFKDVYEDTPVLHDIQL